ARRSCPPSSGSGPMRDFLRSRPFGFALLLSLALLVANIVAEPSFGNPSNWPQELASFAPLAIVAMASTPSILSGGGGLDLSVGPLVIFCNVVPIHLGDKVWFFPGALLTILVPATIWFALSRSAYHRQLYAVGGNQSTAFSAGVDVTKTRIVAYALGGLFAAVGGIALTALVQSSQA